MTPLEQWVKVLGSDAANLTADEIADACWIALIQHRFGVEQPQRSGDKHPPREKPIFPIPPPGFKDPGVPQAVPPNAPPPTPATPGKGGLFPQAVSETLGKDSKPIRVPTAPALRDPLALAKALRPLMQQRDRAAGEQLDEEATVQKIAEERVWAPVTRPLTEPWLELALVVDESPSMMLWRSTIRELYRFFKHYGFFRDVRLWGLTTQEQPSKDEGHLYLRSAPFSPAQSQTLQHPDLLLEPSGRRLILVLSDCVDPLWQQPQLLATLKQWGTCSPMVLMQMMPEWLWQRTHLNQASGVRLQGNEVGVVNQVLEVVEANVSYWRKSKQDKQADIKLPIVTLEAERVQVWTQMLTTQGIHAAPGLLLNPKTQAMARALQQRRQRKSAEQQQSAAVLTAADRVETFRGAASPLAKRLASLLAASPWVTLPIIRIVQETLLPQSQQMHVAEVLLGGILKPKQSPDLHTNPDDVVYQFVDLEVRRELLKNAPVTDTTIVLTRFIQREFNQSLNDFIVELRRWMQSEESEDKKEIMKPLATITADILQYRGAEYVDFVRQVQAYDTPPLPGGGKPQEDLSRDDFPRLEEFEFIDAQFGEPLPEFPPSLQTDTFTVITFELDDEPESAPPQPEADLSLEAFDFTVATLIQEDQQWQVQQHEGRSNRFVEILTGELFQETQEVVLEMVAIPRGSFTMGSPEAEEGRYKDESPLHDVTLEPFLLGRYPVTQAQWRVVASLPLVKRELEPEPSYFKADLRPVERVSWYDAVEFCSRLSAHTGRLYRLPSEAEWEYACRAGTTTVFSFGDMITTEVANYNGSAYADGPAGVSREETTPVNHFQLANPWGLSDMHGNVLEWCQDHGHSNYEEAPQDGSAWLTSKDKARRIYRGGSWAGKSRHCRSAYRYSNGPSDRNNVIGFRVCCAAPRSAE